MTMTYSFDKQYNRWETEPDVFDELLNEELALENEGYFARFYPFMTENVNVLMTTNDYKYVQLYRYVASFLSNWLLLQFLLPCFLHFICFEILLQSFQLLYHIYINL